MSTHESDHSPSILQVASSIAELSRGEGQRAAIALTDTAAKHLGEDALPEFCIGAINGAATALAVYTSVDDAVAALHRLAASMRIAEDRRLKAMN
jgi:hypothetical protein